ncbi:MAG: tRNA threonylcarbamoyladenosine biosynthesis protein TsaE [Bacteroides sp. SM23_62]|nr:MAG: tRNA threonylcarbamoyladenosine biosynthesis protein TsaE [Bacteroides sp. SM23_62]
MLRISIPDLASIDDAARKLIDTLPDKRIFAFYGEMGAGKTTLIKALCRVLKVTDVTSSPSFGLIYEYRTTGSDSVYHFDFYRIEHLEEAYDIGYEEYIESGRYCFIEWPGKVASVLPPETVNVSLHVAENNERIMEVEV